MKKRFIWVMAAVACLGMTACGGVKEKTVSGNEASGNGEEGFAKQSIKVSYAGTSQGIDGIAFEKWAELVAEKTGGAVTLDGYGDCQLSGGDMDRMVELLVQGGAYDLCILSEGVMEGINGEFYALEVPFAFNGYDDVYAHVDSEKGQAWLKEEFSDTGLTYLATLPNGISQLTNAKHEVYEPSDLKDLLIRVYGDSDFRLIKALGADAVPMSFSELYSALQQGTVDGQINGLQTISSANLQEVQKYVTMLNMTWSGYHMVANSKAWSGYSEELRKVLEETSVEAAGYARAHLAEAEEKLRGEFEAAGVVFCDLSEEQLGKFKELALPVADETISTLSENTIEVWELK